jgi:FtsH-binding integral membrane protein
VPHYSKCPEADYKTRYVRKVLAISAVQLVATLGLVIVLRLLPVTLIVFRSWPIGMGSSLAYIACLYLLLVRDDYRWDRS